jgi:hypothetical protein
MFDSVENKERKVWLIALKKHRISSKKHTIWPTKNQKGVVMGKF